MSTVGLGAFLSPSVKTTNHSAVMNEEEVGGVQEQG